MIGLKIWFEIAERKSTTIKRTFKMDIDFGKKTLKQKSVNNLQDEK